MYGIEIFYDTRKLMVSNDKILGQLLTTLYLEENESGSMVIPGLERFNIISFGRIWTEIMLDPDIEKNLHVAWSEQDTLYWGPVEDYIQVEISPGAEELFSEQIKNSGPSILSIIIVPINIK